MSFEDLLKRAHQGDVDAQFEVGNYYDKLKDYTRAIIYYRLSANKHHPVALNHVGWYYQNGYGVWRNYIKAFEYYLLSAEQKCPEGYANIAYCYETGSGVKQDLKKALEYYHLCGNIKYIDECELLILKKFGKPLDEAEYVYAYPLYVKHNYEGLGKLKTLLNDKYIKAMHFMPSVLSDIIISFLL